MFIIATIRLDCVHTLITGLWLTAISSKLDPITDQYRQNYNFHDTHLATQGNIINYNNAARVDPITQINTKQVNVKCHYGNIRCS